MNIIRRNSGTEGWDPFDLVTDLRDEMNRLFSNSLRKGLGREDTGFFAPAIDFREEGDQYFVKTDIPGIKKEDLDISVSGNVLTIKGERKEEKENKGKGFYHSERWAGSFYRSLELPAEVDASKVKAAFKDGVLELSLPKAESAKPKQIKVEVK